MSRPWLAFLAGSFAAALVALVSPAPAAAQKDEDKEDVRFTTFDNVELVGTWYKGSKGKNSPCALLLHAIGGDNSRNKGDWDKLAKALQKHGFAVLSFDFRGHGDSTQVTANFWTTPANIKFVTKSKPNQTAISAKDFKNGYYPFLVNDITAARNFLDQKNDAMECNSGNILVVGAEDGAALGMLWTASEWRRNIGPGFAIGFPGATFMPAGADITAGIWLSFNAPGKGSFFTGSLPYKDWVKVPAELARNYPSPLRNNFDQLFLYGGKEDKGGKAQSEYVFRTVLDADKETKTLAKLKDTHCMDVGDSPGGIALYGKPGLKTDDLIQKYIEKTVDKRTVVWKKRDAATQLYQVPLNDFGFRIP